MFWRSWWSTRLCHCKSLRNEDCLHTQVCMCVYMCAVSVCFSVFRICRILEWDGNKMLFQNLLWIHSFVNGWWSSNSAYKCSVCMTLSTKFCNWLTKIVIWHTKILNFVIASIEYIFVISETLWAIISITYYSESMDLNLFFVFFSIVKFVWTHPRSFVWLTWSLVYHQSTLKTKHSQKFLICQFIGECGTYWLIISFFIIGCTIT